MRNEACKQYYTLLYWGNTGQTTINCDTNDCIQIYLVTHWKKVQNPDDKTDIIKFLGHHSAGVNYFLFNVSQRYMKDYHYYFDAIVYHPRPFSTGRKNRLRVYFRRRCEKLISGWNKHNLTASEKCVWRLNPWDKESFWIKNGEDKDFKSTMLQLPWIIVDGSLITEHKIY